ncbi:hypothetical protein ALO62_102969 [Pseudomonas amygdali pv. myricae]|nr:hypothetical protein ALO62_102969 [Pseudomonas amygdali pv. myricae]RMT47789.1 hypothetical protein ALP46_102280 [Pseudomonas amygdali pv. myricae]RMV29738.1 hypothetical protein ALP14_102264 [Pseudomonas amygdali pv. myricae]
MHDIVPMSHCTMKSLFKFKVRKDLNFEGNFIKLLNFSQPMIDLIWQMVLDTSFYRQILSPCFKERELLRRQFFLI